jgi:hypothetical protein
MQSKIEGYVVIYKWTSKDVKKKQKSVEVLSMVWLKVKFFVKNPKDVERVLSLQSKRSYKIDFNVGLKEIFKQFLTNKDFERAKLVYNVWSTGEFYKYFFYEMQVESVTVWLAIEKMEHLEEVIELMKEIDFTLEVED